MVFWLKLTALSIVTALVPLQSFGEPLTEAKKVGFILSLSGAWSHFGEAQRNALEMAREDRPKLFADLDFIYEDCRYDSKTAVTSFKKLVDSNGVKAVFVWGVEPSLALAPLAESRKIALFVSALDPSAAVNREYVVRTINPASDHSKKLVRYLNSQGYKRLTIVKSEISFFDILVEELKRHKSGGQQISVIDTYLPEQLDFRSTVTKLKAQKDSNKFDAIGVYLGPTQVPPFFRQAGEQQIESLFFGATPFQSKTVIESSLGHMEGALFAHNFVEDDFRRRYITRVGDDLQIPWAANAYDFAIVIGETFAALKNDFSAQAILDKATSFDSRSGVGGDYSFIDSKNLGKYFRYPIAIYRVAGDSYEVVTK